MFLFCYWHPDQRLATQRLKQLHTNTQGKRCGQAVNLRTLWSSFAHFKSQMVQKTFGSKFNVLMQISQRVAISRPVSDPQHPGLFKTFTVRLISANRFLRSFFFFFKESLKKIQLFSSMTQLRHHVVSDINESTLLFISAHKNKVIKNQNIVCIYISWLKRILHF